MSGFIAPRRTATPMPAFIDQDREVERLPLLDAPLHHGGDVGHHGEPVAGRLFEAWPEIADHHLGDARTEDLQVGRPGAPREDRHEREPAKERDATQACHGLATSMSRNLSRKLSTSPPPLPERRPGSQL